MVESTQLEIEIKRAEAGDADAIVERWRELMDAHRHLDRELYALRRGADRHFRAFLEKQIREPRALVLVASDGRDIIGYLLGRVGQRAPVYEIRDVAMIFDLAVRRGSRRFGVGRRLVEDAHQFFRGLGFRFVQVNFAHGNPTASQFWPALGYESFLQDAYFRL